MAEAHNLTHNLTSQSERLPGWAAARAAGAGGAGRGTPTARARDTALGSRHAHGATGNPEMHSPTRSVKREACVLTRTPRKLVSINRESHVTKH